MTHTHAHRIPAAPVALGTVAVIAASLLVEIAPGEDVSYPLFVLAGPVLTGVALGLRWRIGAAAWFAAAVFALVVDWIVNHEDVLFHVALGVVWASLVALGGVVGKRRRAYTASP
jgi:hypothetical protein